MSLPEGYEQRIDPQGRVYFVNHKDQSTSWVHPLYQGTTHPNPTQTMAQVVAEPVEAHAPVVVVPPQTAQPVAHAAHTVVVAAHTPTDTSRAATRPPPSGYVAYESSGASGPAPASKKAGGVKQVSSRTGALTKSLLVGQVAPSRLYKSGTLTLDGAPMYVQLKGGILTIAPDKKTDPVFRCPIKYINVVADGATRKTVKHHRRGRDELAPNEIRLKVDPEALNREINAQNNSGMPFGWIGHLRVGASVQETSHTASIQRQDFSLFAPTPTDRQSWFIQLNTAASSTRSWGYVSHEIKDSWAYLSGKKK